MKTHPPFSYRFTIGIPTALVISAAKLPRNLRVFFFLGIFFFFLVSLPAQSIGRQFLGGMGGSFIYEDARVNWTAGEMAVAHLETAKEGYRITEGFQQALIEFNKISVNSESWISLDPNPVKDFLRIRQLKPSPQGMFLRIMNAQGQQMFSPQKLDVLPDELNLSTYPSGIYFVQILHVDYSVIQVVKILKVKS